MCHKQHVDLLVLGVARGQEGGEVVIIIVPPLGLKTQRPVPAFKEICDSRRAGGVEMAAVDGAQRAQVREKGGQVKIFHSRDPLQLAQEAPDLRQPVQHAELQMILHAYAGRTASLPSFAASSRLMPNVLHGSSAST